MSLGGLGGLRRKGLGYRAAPIPVRMDMVVLLPAPLWPHQKVWRYLAPHHNLEPKGFDVLLERLPKLWPLFGSLL